MLDKTVDFYKYLEHFYNDKPGKKLFNLQVVNYDFN